MEVSQSRVSQLYGQFQEAGEAGLVVKKATGAPPKLTTEPRAQLTSIILKRSRTLRFWGRGLDQTSCWRSHQTTLWGTLRSRHDRSPSETIGFDSPETDTLLLSSKLVTSHTVAEGDFARAKKHGCTRGPTHLFCRWKCLLFTSSN